MHCLHRMEVLDSPTLLGNQSVQVHGPDHAFALTPLAGNQTAYRRHLEILLRHTRLKAVPWINLNRSHVELLTIEREKPESP